MITWRNSEAWNSCGQNLKICFKYINTDKIKTMMLCLRIDKFIKRRHQVEHQGAWDTYVVQQGAGKLPKITFLLNKQQANSIIIW